MIGRKAFLAFIGNVVRHGLGYVGLFFVARLMGPEALGIVGFGFAYVGIIAFMADLGFGAAHIKKISEGHDGPVCIGTFAAIRLGLTGVAVLVAVSTVLVLKYVIGRPFETPQHETVIYLALATVALGSISDVIRLTFAARRETAKQTVVEFVSKAVEVGVKILTALLGLGVVMLAGASVVGVLAGLLVFAFLFRHEPVSKPTQDMWRQYWMFALPVTVVVSTNAVTENLDKVMVQFFWSSTELGYYEGAQRISMVFMFIGTAVGTLLFSTVSASHGARNFDAVRSVTIRAERYLALLLLPLAAIVVFLRGPIIRLLLGSAFDSSIPILAMLCLSMVVNLVSIPYATQIIGVGKPGLSGRLGVLLMVVNVSLNLIFIPRSLGGWPLFGWGAFGAAGATLVGAVIMAGVFRYYAYRLTGTRTDTASLRAGLAAALMTAVMFATGTWLGMDGVWGPTAAVALGILAYAVGLMSLSAVSAADIAYLAGTASPWAMVTYILDELRGKLAGKPENGEGR